MMYHDKHVNAKVYHPCFSKCKERIWLDGRILQRVSSQVHCLTFNGIACMDNIQWYTLLNSTAYDARMWFYKISHMSPGMNLELGMDKETGYFSKEIMLL